MTNGPRTVQLKTCLDLPRNAYTCLDQYECIDLSKCNTVSDNWRAFKKDEKYFLFLVKRSAFEIFTFLAYNVLAMKRNGLRRLISIILTYQTGQQIVAMHKLPNAPRSKGNQAMKFGQLVEYSVKNIFLQKPCKKWDTETGTKTVFVF